MWFTVVQGDAGLIERRRVLVVGSSDCFPGTEFVVGFTDLIARFCFDVVLAAFTSPIT